MEVIIRLPSQKAVYPLHILNARHFLTEDPLNLNPLSQENLILFGYTVELPNDDPFIGTAN
jgi:hypothetical protein